MTLLSGSRTHNRADLHTLCHIVGMINLFYIAGSQTDLVAVGSCSRDAAPRTSFFWGSLPFKSLRYRIRWDPPHRSHAWPDIHKLRPESGSRIAPPRQVAAPPKGSISVGWLWVSFLKFTSHSSVYRRQSFHGNNDGAGIDLIGLLLILPACLLSSAYASPSAPDPSGRQTCPFCPLKISARSARYCW